VDDEARGGAPGSPVVGVWAIVLDVRDIQVTSTAGTRIERRLCMSVSIVTGAKGGRGNPSTK
jgi:hypothetical protein